MGFTFSNFFTVNEINGVEYTEPDEGHRRTVCKTGWCSPESEEESSTDSEADDSAGYTVGGMGYVLIDLFI